MSRFENSLRSTEVTNVSGKDFVLLRRFRGGSQPLLLQDGEGRRWVLKLNGNPNGRNVLANDLIGTELMTRLGLPCMPYARVHLKSEFFDNRETWFRENVSLRRPEAGVHFASRFLPDLLSGEIYDYIPASYLARVANPEDFVGAFVFDLWAGHRDYRQALYRVRTPGSPVEAIFIDNGHLFGGPDWDLRKSPTHPYLTQQQRALLRRSVASQVDTWVRTLQADIPELMAKVIADLPHEWYNNRVDCLVDDLTKRTTYLPEIVHCSVESAGGLAELFSRNRDDDPAENTRALSRHG